MSRWLLNAPGSVSLRARSLPKASSSVAPRNAVLDLGLDGQRVSLSITELCVLRVLQDALLKIIDDLFDLVVEDVLGRRLGGVKVEDEVTDCYG